MSLIGIEALQLDIQFGTQTISLLHLGPNPSFDGNK